MGLALAVWADRVKRRDDDTCQGCGCTERRVLHAHHIVPKSEAPDDALNIENGITLCANCHALAHRGALEIFAYGKRRTPPYIPPPAKPKRAWTARQEPDGEPISGMWTVSQAAHILSVSDRHIRRIVERGFVLAETRRGATYILPESLESYIEACAIREKGEREAALAVMAEQNTMHQRRVAALVMDRLLDGSHA